eukprot:SM000156S02170  [mRNA]  locus=s156:296823:297719:- [translate_table: standard]
MNVLLLLAAGWGWGEASTEWLTCESRRRRVWQRPRQRGCWEWLPSATEPPPPTRQGLRDADGCRAGAAAAVAEAEAGAVKPRDEGGPAAFLRRELLLGQLQRHKPAVVGSAATRSPAGKRRRAPEARLSPGTARRARRRSSPGRDAATPRLAISGAARRQIRSRRVLERAEQAQAAAAAAAGRGGGQRGLPTKPWDAPLLALVLSRNEINDDFVAISGKRCPAKVKKSTISAKVRERLLCFEPMSINLLK